MDKRAQLEQWTTLVADTGDLDKIADLQPEDATTNPSLLLAAAREPRYQHLLEQARTLCADLGHAGELDWLTDTYACLAGQAILERIPGLVSTEVDARLSFDSRATVEKARRLIAIYRELEVDPSRILIKIAATWEGIRAAEVLEEEGTRCNLTLVFSPSQALAAAEAGATLISPFVGRIADWHRKNGQQWEAAQDDPGVQSVRHIYQCFKARGLETIVMGASFRNTGQIEALAGCDRLTISPALLGELAADSGTLTRVLDSETIEPESDWQPVCEATFRWQLNDNAMATELLSDGIRRFAADQQALETLLMKEA
ncbi:transaldolase B [Alcanivorax hongdengensis A-11-3]|uniref:transaldolase n=1 Tax=Alcanivorax hongdengensis A-11-3 TaxID=1177179 RepID=L0W7W6_9GAMM|nr:transaldolase [Alcanivorax hongdengensis]EKF72996.1 transaldolase B [Alcanivorax hongdengensis A-11-3]